MKKQIAISMLLMSTLLVGCQASPTAKEKTVEPSRTEKASPNNTNNMQTAKPEKGDTIAILDTDKGTIKIKLFPKEVPEITKNFIELAKAGKYDGVPFHRVIEGFMIQTGDFTAQNGTGGYSYLGAGTTIADEFSPKLKHLKGAVSMANSGPNTNGSQFFIVTADKGYPSLNSKYSIFGQVYEGQENADAISKVATNSMDAPLSPVTIKHVTISEY